MGCYRCGARQVDPVRGASPWRRGVRLGEQVLVCPDCQRDRDWTAELDQCPGCGSTALVRRLGMTVCRGCGREWTQAATATPTPTQRDGRTELQMEVAAALDRAFGRAHQNSPQSGA
jgi:hypothetical protein